MTLENSIKDVISKKLEDGTVEKLIEQQLEKGVINALENMFKSYGDVTKVIEAQVKSVMIPYLESYDYSKYIMKLDSVLVDVLSSSALENKKLLKNFKTVIESDEEKEIKVSELYERWMKYVSENVNTSDLEVNTDDGISYEYVDVHLSVDHDESRSWSSYEYANLIFECEHDEEMNQSIRLYRWKDEKNKGWDIERHDIRDIKSLRYLDEFELLLMNLSQNRTKIIIDTDEESDEVKPEAEPEATFS
ncbi:hypothetical protein L8C07_06245 [Paenibacillus sp. CMAA1739]|uniref:hypothetical protein n=1 Tax=Paenibacillus ottowii TaxID=2315729 RepID=UPI002DBBE8EC|nr:hypothetical protein [Paenibacillus sp. CMAA1739]MEC4565541.1 hypothetical protein [Paenibacillus sp. CMAA1739]